MRLFQINSFSGKSLTSQPAYRRFGQMLLRNFGRSRVFTNHGAEGEFGLT